VELKVGDFQAVDDFQARLTELVKAEIGGLWNGVDIATAPARLFFGAVSGKQQFSISRFT
jgi:hypothetical protein